MNDQPTELREFIYLDEISLNNHLSTLGSGIPKEIVQESCSETEKSGSGEGNFTLPLTSFGIKGGGEISHLSKENMLTRMQITAPYRFEEFLKSLPENGFEVLGNEELREAIRGKVVKIEGKIWPMSLFKVETAIKLFLEMFEEGTLENLEELPDDNGSDAQEVLSEEDFKQFKSINQLIEKFIGEKIPVRMYRNGYDIGIALDRNYMRANPFRTFAEQKEFTLVGRVKERLSPSDTWDPNNLTSLTREYLSQDQANETLESLEQDLEGGEQFNISFEEKDKLIQGLGLVVSPIAIYW